MKVAAVQYAPKFKDADANIKTMTVLVRAAASHGAKLIVLPELATSGYSFMSVEEARPFAEVLTEPKHEGAGDRKTNSMGAMTDLASELDVAIAWGLVEEDPGTRSLYNSQVLTLPSGQWVSYRKINRWGNDLIWAKKGDKSPPIVEHQGKRIGLLICRDIRDKEASSADDIYEPGDADIIAYSSNFGDGGFPAVSWVDFAEDNKVWVVVSNRYGQERNNDFGEGGICVISPAGDISCDGLTWNQPCVVYASVP